MVTNPPSETTLGPGLETVVSKAASEPATTPPPPDGVQQDHEGGPSVAEGNEAFRLQHEDPMFLVSHNAVPNNTVPTNRIESCHTMQQLSVLAIISASSSHCKDSKDQATRSVLAIISASSSNCQDRQEQATRPASWIVSGTESSRHDPGRNFDEVALG